MKNRKKYLKRRAKWRRLVNEGLIFETGFVCDECGAMLYDFPLYDTKGCISCGTWADDTCGDPNCELCSKRPASPLGVMFDADTELGGHIAVRHALLRKRSLQDNYFHKNNGRKRREKRLEYIKSHRKR